LRKKEKEKEKEIERGRDVESGGKEIAKGRSAVDAMSCGSGSKANSESESMENSVPTLMSSSSDSFNVLPTTSLLEAQQQQQQQRKNPSMPEVCGVADSLSVGSYSCPGSAHDRSVSEDCPATLEPPALLTTEESHSMAWEDESGKDVTHTCDVVRQGSDDDVDVDERGQLEKPTHGIDCQMPPPISTISKRIASHPVHIDPTNSSSSTSMSSSSTSMSSAAPALDPILVAKALSKVPPFARAGLKKRMEQQLQQQHQQQQLQQQQQQKAVACTGPAEGATGSRSSDFCHSEATSLPSLPLDQEERREMLGSQWEQHRQKVRKASTLQT
jgi:hypothetical protein